MKKLLELICCLLHPIAVVLIFVTIPFKSEFKGIEKLMWAILSIIPLVPFVYVLTGHEFL
ncbi:MAG: hypothetical protein ACYCU0_10090 [Solirubrobacteraceae bacterium]